jgi:Peptidase S46
VSSLRTQPCVATGHFRTRMISPKRFSKLLLPVLAACILINCPGFADEGLWPYNDPPSKLLEERYGSAPAAACLEHSRKATVRFTDGSCGAFVSEDGLVITSYQTGASFLRKLSDDAHDFRSDGFHAAGRTEEKRCPSLQLNVLDRIEDVTARVKEAADPALNEEESLAARQAAVAKIEKESADQPGRRCQVVSFFGGSKFDLYIYRRYSDIRLVFAPEEQAADFGGAADAREYPRCSFDACLFRA